MPAGEYKFQVERGESVIRSLSWKDSAGGIVPLAGGDWTGSFKVFPSKASSVPILQITSAPALTLSSTAPNVVFHISGAQTAALPIGQLWYRLDLSRTSDGFVKYLLRGFMTVIR